MADELRYIVRIAGKDLDGTVTVERAVRGLKGVGHRYARIAALIFAKKTGISIDTADAFRMLTNVANAANKRGLRKLRTIALSRMNLGIRAAFSTVVLVRSNSRGSGLIRCDSAT